MRPPCEWPIRKTGNCRIHSPGFGQGRAHVGAELLEGAHVDAQARAAAVGAIVEGVNGVAVLGEGRAGSAKRSECSARPCRRTRAARGAAGRQDWTKSGVSSLLLMRPVECSTGGCMFIGL